ncbi:MAG: glycerol-3-phosphate dehydrogenase/oxidase [Anaerolineales bacterium]
MMRLARQERIRRLQGNPAPDVLIVGAGINGIGTFRDLALQGVSVALIDRGDYCSGASAASSHMVHGGIRYLENGEFRLVREAVRERNRLIENAPQLVKPLPTTFPIFKRFSGLLNAPLKFLRLLNRPAERGALVIKLGLLFYDWFTRAQRVVPRHVFRSRAESLVQFPALNPQVLYTATYYDAAMPSPERLALEVLKDGEGAGDHAIPLNYVSLVSAKGSEVRLRDEVTGEEFVTHPKLLVNAAGPWIDLVNASMANTTRFIGGTKGSHVVLDHPELRAAIGEHEFFFENEDGRFVLIFPLEDRVLVGTSDIRVDSPEGVTITDEEIEYFFGMIRRVFPAIEIDRSHIVFTFSGVRPLAFGSVSEEQMSRDHKIEMLEPDASQSLPIVSLVGGKWTTFRAFSEQASNVILGRLGLSRKASTANLKIGATRAQAKADLETLIAEEDVVHLDDLLFRRTNTCMLGRATEAKVREFADLAGRTLGWPAERKVREIARMKDILLKKHKMRFTRLAGDVLGKEVL